jgi:hypothetical protein
VTQTWPVVRTAKYLQNSAFAQNLVHRSHERKRFTALAGACCAIQLPRAPRKTRADDRLDGHLPLDRQDRQRLEDPVSNGEPCAAPQVDVSVRIEAPAAKDAIEVPRRECGLSDRRAVGTADMLDRLQDHPRRVIGGGCVALGLASEALDVALVERAASAFEQRRRNASESDQRALGIRASVADEGVLEQRVGTHHPDSRRRLTDVAPQWRVGPGRAARQTEHTLVLDSDSAFLHSHVTCGSHRVLAAARKGIAVKEDEPRFPRDPAMVAPTERPQGYFPEPERGIPPFAPLLQRGQRPSGFPPIGEPQCACQASAVFREGQSENPDWPTMYRVPPGGYPAAATLPLVAGSYAIFASANVHHLGTSANVGLSATL